MIHEHTICVTTCVISFKVQKIVWWIPDQLSCFENAEKEKQALTKAVQHLYHTAGKSVGIIHVKFKMVHSFSSLQLFGSSIATK